MNLARKNTLAFWECVNFMFLSYILILWLCWLLWPPVKLFLTNVDITKKRMIEFQLEIIVPPNLSFLPTTRLNEPSDNSIIFVVATEHKTGSKQFKTAQSYVVLLFLHVHASSHTPYIHAHTYALFLPIHLYFLLSAHWKSPSEREWERCPASHFPHSVYLFTSWVKRASQSNLWSFLHSLSDCLEQNAGEI